MSKKIFNEKGEEVMSENGQEEKIFPKKSLGQNFLRSEKALRQIVEAGSLTKKDLIIEIGPGEGILTEKLLATGATVISVEKDDRLAPMLIEKFAEEIKKGQLKIIHSDVLTINIQEITSGKKYKLIANIPYYITGMILQMFLEANHKPEKIVLLVQKEVAERIVSRDKKESILSLSVKLFGKPKIIDRVPRGAFYPMPTVDSAIILIDEIAKTYEENMKKVSTVASTAESQKKFVEKFFAQVKKAFNQKRKQMGHTLGVTDLQMKIVNKNLSSKSRPEELSVDDWISLCDIID